MLRPKVYQTFCFGIFSFCILLNYALLKTIKDGFIIKAIGAESLGFIKLYLVFPMTFLFIFAYTYFSNKISQPKLFSVFATIFLLNFIFLFLYIIPHASDFTLTKEKTDYLTNLYPRVKWFIKIFSFWPYSILFVLAELWGGIIYTVFFWQLANRVNSENEAKFVYPFIAMFGNASLVVADIFMNKYIHNDLHMIFIIIIITNIVVCVVYLILNIVFRKKIALYNAKPSMRLSLKESFKFILSYKYLWLMFFSLAFFGIVLNMVEIFSKANLSKIYSSQENYMLSLSKIQSYQAIVSGTFILFSSIIVRNVKWNILNLITPYTVVITSSVFFLLISFGNYLTEYLSFSFLELAVAIGVMQMILSRSFRHSFFDPSREMLYIKLRNTEIQTKGKASTDILGGKLGKSGAGIIETVLFTLFPTYSLDNAVFIFTIIFFILAVVWIHITNILSREYKNL